MRLLSYNIHKGVGGRDRRYRLGRVLDAIEAEAPDLACLQEVDRRERRSGFDDQPRLLAERLGFHAYFQLNVRAATGGYGNLVLSRWPLLSRRRVSLRLGWRKPRGAQVVAVDTPEGPLLCVNWHLGLAERERRWQAMRLLGHRQLRSSDHLPTIIAGDFNDWRGTLGRSLFARHGFSEVTRPARRFRTFPASLPIASLDKAFTRGGIVVDRVGVVRNALTRRASDHLPLVIDFHLEGRTLEGGTHP